MKNRKRLFIGLSLLSLILITLMLRTGWYLATHRLTWISKSVIYLTGAASLSFIAVVAFGVLAVIWALWSGRMATPLQFIMGGAVGTIFPLALRLGRVIGIDQDVIKSSFIEVSNQLVRIKHYLVEPQRLLILAPHCLQKTECPHKVTVSARNCRRCGACPIGSLLELADRYEVGMVVATGGTLARKFIREFHPRAVVAIACERDLTSGIQDTPLPVLGVLNDRPNGPCFNTRVNLQQVEQAIQQFLRGGQLRTDG